MYEYKEEYTIARMAKALNVSESGYYKWEHRAYGPPTEKVLEDMALLKEIKELFMRSRGSYGILKITAIINSNRLKKSQKPVNHKRIERLMRENGIFSRTSRKYRSTTDSDHDYPIAENLLDRDFKSDKPNEKMVSDTTLVFTDEGKLYLAGILDLCGRIPVGLAISGRNDRFLTLGAFEEMIVKGYGGNGCILHSDRGSTYASKEYREALERHGIICSMSKKGDCWDNAPMESFWGKMKTEWLKPRYKTKKEAIKDIYEYVWKFYTYERPHEANGYMTPAEYYESRNE